jgi:hypothetical protein
MIGRKGLFGKTKTDGEITYTPQAQAVMDGSAPMPQKRGGGIKDVLLGALGGAADSAATFFGGQPLIAQQQQMQQMMAMRQAEQERARSMDLADYRTKLGIQQEFAQPEVDEFDAAMMRANIPKGSPRYQEFAEIYAARKAQGPDPMLQGAPLPGGGTYTGPFSGYSGMANQGRAQSGAPDTLPPDFFDGPQRAQQAPAQPITGARRINRQQYEQQLREFGGDQMSMNAWMRANNVIAGN